MINNGRKRMPLDYMGSKQRIKSLRKPMLTDAGLFWIIYILLIIGTTLVWIK